MSKRKKVRRKDSPRKTVLGAGLTLVLDPSDNAKVKRRKETPSPPVPEPPLSPEDEKILSMFFDSVDRTINELVPYARKHGAVGKTESFPARRAKELQEKMVKALAEWAIEAMGEDFKRYLVEGEKNFLCHFALHLENPFRTEPTVKSPFWNAFERSRFTIPARPRRIDSIHPSDWPDLVRTPYKNALDRIKKIPLSTRRQRGAYLMALKEILPGFNDKRLTELVDKGSKRSDIAAEYVAWNFEVGGQAVKEYLSVFNKDERYGYLDFLAARHNKIK